MKSKNLFGMLQIAVVAAIGTTQLHQALPIMARLAQRTAAPLEQMVRPGVNPSYPRSPVPAVQPFVEAAPVQVCERTLAMAMPRSTVLRVQAPRPTVETIADSIPARFIAPRVRVNAPDPQMIAQLVQMHMNSAEFAREMARAQRDIQRAMREAERQRTISF